MKLWPDGQPSSPCTAENQNPACPTLSLMPGTGVHADIYSYNAITAKRIDKDFIMTFTFIDDNSSNRWIIKPQRFVIPYDEHNKR